MRSDRLRLQDILDAMQAVADYLPVDRVAFDRDPPLQSHIYRHVMIVGEAAWNLSKALKAQNGHIRWKRIEGMRHIMVHDYFKVDWDIVYGTAQNDLPVFNCRSRPCLPGSFSSIASFTKRRRNPGRRCRSTRGEVGFTRGLKDPAYLHRCH